MDGKQYLNKDELDNLIANAKGWGIADEANFVFSVVPFIGLSMDEFLHLRPSWIYWRDANSFRDSSPPEIHIPAKETCQNLRWDGKPPKYTRKAGSCTNCQEAGETDNWEATCRIDKKEDTADRDLSRKRVVPVKNATAEIQLRRWFQTLGRPGIPWSPQGLIHLIKSIGNRSSVTDKINYRSLRWTFVHILAESGVAKTDIIRYAPTSQLYEGTARKILEESSTDYSFQIKTLDRLKTLDTVGPATFDELAEVHGTTYKTESDVIRNLQDLGYVVCKGKRETEKTQNPREYTVHPEFDPFDGDGFPCPKDSCDRGFDTLRGKGVHATKAHNID